MYNNFESSVIDAKRTYKPGLVKPDNEQKEAQPSKLFLKPPIITLNPRPTFPPKKAWPLQEIKIKTDPLLIPPKKRT